MRCICRDCRITRFQIANSDAGAVAYLLDEFGEDGLLEQDAQGRTAVYYAAGLGHVSLMKRILDMAGATQMGKKQMACLADDRNMTPLIVAVNARHR